ncbi:4Fe-4S ferredoxin [Caproiciproducens sp. NJN-50]|uniref:ATP-binding protein n=1 Tax=Caproiciproducens sp. NJN-50 TaxID=2507162 RepID=UPI000FFE09BE|nr:4Fe-4S binding protein [Caproiciproducens sp. NJN-50]QAT48862.1 4Fe-4S ferredoxin [Caproiciproducens sp. NJN-50]
MIRRLIQIDEKKCNGCGLCADACQEGAIAMVNGKAKLVREDYCDGLGNCLPACPAGAISFEEREAPAFDAEAASKHSELKQAIPQGCPGSMAKMLKHPAPIAARPEEAEPAGSELMQWPVQIKLVPVKAPYFDGADLLVAADCTAYAFAGFHRKFMKNRVTLIGCPKLDEGDYSEKLTEILKENRIRSVKVVRMEVPCCGGIENAVRQALLNSGKMIPWQVVVLSTDGRVLEE